MEVAPHATCSYVVGITASRLLQILKFIPVWVKKAIGQSHRKMCEDINCYPWVGKLLHFKWQRVGNYNFMFSYAPLDILLMLGQKSLGQTKDPFSPIACSQALVGSEGTVQRQRWLQVATDTGHRHKLEGHWTEMSVILHEGHCCHQQDTWSRERREIPTWYLHWSDCRSARRLTGVCNLQSSQKHKK